MAEGYFVSVSALQRIRATPDGEISVVSDSIVLAGHPYALSPYRTESHLAGLDSATLPKCVKSQITRLRTVSSSSVRQAARKYMQNIHFVYAGDTTRVSRKSFVKLQD